MVVVFPTPPFWLAMHIILITMYPALCEAMFLLYCGRIKKYFSFWLVFPMFYVEHKMKYFFFAFYALLLTSCFDTVANPELTDEIYKDYVAELGIVKKSLEEEEKYLLTNIEERARAVPQTGQIKFSNKKVSDSEEKIQILRQQKQYFEIKIEQRALLAKQRHSESLRKNGRPWPDKDEVALYKAEAKFRRDKISWEKTKGVKKAVPRGTEGPKTQH